MQKQIMAKSGGMALLLAIVFLIAFLLPVANTARAAEEGPAADTGAGQADEELYAGAQELEDTLEDPEEADETDETDEPSDPDEEDTPSDQDSQAMAKAKGVIIIDPGHMVSESGNDPGAWAPDGSTNEAKLNPVLAAKIATQLKNRGYMVYTTFKIADGIPHLLPLKAISLLARAQTCNKVQPDLFMSVHHNSSGHKTWTVSSGTLAIYDPQQENTYRREESKALAEAVSSSVRSLGYTRGDRASSTIQASPFVLHYSSAPAITLEAGFLTSQSDLAFLTNSAKQDEMATKAVLGIEKFFDTFPPLGAIDPKDKSGPKLGKLAFGATMPTSKPEFLIRAKNVKDKSGVREVKFRVWPNGDTKAQKVYEAVREPDNNWAATFKLGDFGYKSGIYKVTAYGTDRANNTSNLGTYSFQIKDDKQAPTADKILFGEVDPTYATSFAIRAKGVTDASGIRNVKFRVWPKNNSELAKTYTGISVGNNDWDVSFNTSDFGDRTGIYMVKVSGTDNRGNTAVMLNGQIQVMADTQPPTMEKVIFGEKSPTDKPSFAIRAQGVKDNVKVESVKFRVWNSTSNTGAKTYNGIDKGNGNWDILLNLRDFKYKIGTYKVQVYGYDKAGNSAIMGSGSIVVDGEFDSKPPTMSKIMFSEKNPTSANTFTIQANSVQDDTGVEKVRFRIYRKVDGENSYKSFTGKKRGNNWEMTFKLSDFKNKTGTYVVQAYGYDTMGNSGFMGSSTIKVTGDTSPPYMEHLLFSVTSPTSINTFTIQANNVSDPAGIASIRFRVWNSADRKTVKSFAGKKNGKNWDMTFKLSNFKNESGEYQVRVYGTDKKGNTGQIGSGSIVVNKTVGNVFIMGQSTATVQQMVNFFRASGYTYPDYYAESPRDVDLATMAQLYTEVCKAEGVRVDVAWAQMCLETKFLNFGNDVKLEQFNFAGIGATGGGNPGYDFSAEWGNDAKGIKYGVIAHVQHLKAYASAADPVYVKSSDSGSPDYNKPVDPRWHLVSRGCAPTVEALSGKWATGSSYGAKVIDYINQINAASKQTGGGETAETAAQSMEEQAVADEVVYPVMKTPDAPEVTKEQLMNYYIRNAQAIAANDAVDERTAFPLRYGISLEEFVDLYMHEAASEGVDVAVAFAQAMEDTNFLRYGGKIAPGDNVFMAYDAPDKIVYETVQQGIRAHIQHLKCLADSGDCVNSVVDKLWDDALRGTVPDAAMLNGRDYGKKLLQRIKELLAEAKDTVQYIQPAPEPEAQPAPEAPQEEPIAEQPPQPEPEQPEQPEQEPVEQDDAQPAEEPEDVA